MDLWCVYQVMIRWAAPSGSREPKVLAFQSFIWLQETKYLSWERWIKKAVQKLNEEENRVNTKALFRLGSEACPGLVGTRMGLFLPKLLYRWKEDHRELTQLNCQFKTKGKTKNKPTKITVTYEHEKCQYCM